VCGQRELGEDAQLVARKRRPLALAASMRQARRVIKASSLRHHDVVQWPRERFRKVQGRPAKAARKPAWADFHAMQGAVVSVMKVVVVSCSFNRGKPSRQPPGGAVLACAASSPCHQRQRDSVFMRLAFFDPQSAQCAQRQSGCTDAPASAFPNPGTEGV